MLTFLSVFIITFINLSLNKFINNYLPNSNDENMLVIKNKTIAYVQEKEFLRLWQSIK